ncbi:MAG: hypothetical protein Crog4KO_27120 [Crocinitomicaceae bacterium]
MIVDKQIIIVNGLKFSGTPRIFLNDFRVLLTNCKSFDEFNSQNQHNYGSVDDWLGLSSIDTISFNRNSKLLASLYLKIPESNFEIEGLDVLGKKNGWLKFIEPNKPMLVEPFEYKHYFEELDLLFCFENSETVKEGIEELKLNQQISLFFDSNNNYCAWGLYSPGEWITDGFEELQSRNEPFLKKAIKSCLELMDTTTYNLMDIEDEEILIEIASLYKDLSMLQEKTESRQVELLKSWLLDQCDRYYFNLDYKEFFQSV